MIPRKRPTGGLSKEAVIDILTSGESNRLLAERYDRTSSLISLVRCGRLYSDIRPDLPRRGRDRRLCTGCCHWRDSSCGFGFPDPQELGLHFAAECLNFQQPDP